MKMMIRKAKPEDAQNILEWGLAQQEKNELDVNCLLYPSTEVLCAENGQAVAYLPVQLAAMLESVIVNPNVDRFYQNQALYYLVSRILEDAAKQGIREAYFLGTDEEISKLAEKVGFKELPWKVFRIRLRGPSECEPTT